MLSTGLAEIGVSEGGASFLTPLPLFLPVLPDKQILVPLHQERAHPWKERNLGMGQGLFVTLLSTDLTSPSSTPRTNLTT